MNRNSKQSDQLYNWSAKNEAIIKFKAAQAATHSYYSIEVDRTEGPTWIANRTIQEMRQAWLQMCRWRRSRTEILSVSKPAREASRNGVCPSRLFGRGQRALRESQRNPKGVRGALRDQSGAAEEARRAVGSECGISGCRINIGGGGYWGSRSIGCQYAGASSQKRCCFRNNAGGDKR